MAMSPSAARGSRKAQLYVPAARSSPSGLADKLPVLATQNLFRSNVVSTGISVPSSNALASSGSRLQVMSSVPSGAATSSSMGRAWSPSNEYATVSPHKTAAHTNHTQATANISSSSALHHHPLVAAVDGNKSLQRLKDEVDGFLNQELGIIGSQSGGSGDDVGPQRLAVYKAVFRMILPAVPQQLQGHLEAVMSEYDRFLQSLEVSAENHTRIRERQRLEVHYAQHFTEEARIKEAELEKKRKEFASTEASLKVKMLHLEQQLTVLQNENRSLKAQQNEDTERYSAMAQSVIDSRLAANKAELAFIEMKEIYDRVRHIEKDTNDIVSDYGKMLKLIRMNKLVFEPKSTVMIDTLLREGTI